MTYVNDFFKILNSSYSFFIYLFKNSLFNLTKEKSTSLLLVVKTSATSKGLKKFIRDLEKLIHHKFLAKALIISICILINI